MFMNHRKSLLAIVTMLFLLAQPIATLAFINSISVAPSWDLNQSLWYGPTSSWDSAGYTVKRYSVDNVALFNALQDKPLRDLGFAAFTDAESNLYLFSTNQHKLVQTNYKVSQAAWCDGCATSTSTQYVGTVTMKDGKTVVRKDNDWYLLNPFTLQADLWISASKVKQATGQDYWTARVSNNQLILTTGFGSGQSHYAVTQPNVFVANTTLRWSEALPSQIASPALHPHLMVTDKNGTLSTGQIDKGIYVTRGATLTKIGYTERASRTKYSYVTRYEPRFIDVNNVSWIGADGAFYVAELRPNDMKNTGIVDVPRGVPFRSQSSPEVYYVDLHNVSNFYALPSAYNFENEQDYYDVMNNGTFSDLIWLPDSAVDHQALQAQILETNRLTQNSESFRSAIRKLHR
ncbi:hypothetical protein HQ524_03665 [Candidatus Uhrbacteria bacterium]|nr:hypothetical protein [Candidatus Uhrbacteria bacterium]